MRKRVRHQKITQIMGSVGARYKNKGVIEFVRRRRYEVLGVNTRQARRMGYVGVMDVLNGSGFVR